MRPAEGRLLCAGSHRTKSRGNLLSPQEQLLSLCLWPVRSWHFLAQSWLPGSAPALYPLQGLRALGLCVQARPNRDWSKPARPWQPH